MKIVFCWATVSGFMASAWRVLAAREDIELFVIARGAMGKGSKAPYCNSVMEGVPSEIIDQDEVIDERELRQLVVSHNPDVLFISGWHTRAYRRLALAPELKGVRMMMGMDTQRRDTWRQRFGRVAMARFFGRLDRVMVPGERGYQLARLLGFAESQIVRGLLPADLEAFEPALRERISRSGGWPRRFLYVGRYVDVKGIDVLLEAYRQYRIAVDDAWPLTCCGTGRWAEAIIASEGVEDRGFVQPGDLSKVYAEAGAFILPSRFEPFGVVVTEACAAGLPVICTEEVGAGVELVRSFYNGHVVPTGNPDSLAWAMRWIHERWDQLPEMGLRSQALAAPFGAELWAERVECQCRAMLSENS